MLYMDMGQHAVLYLTGHAQFAAYAILLGVHLTQTLQVARCAPHNESNQYQACKYGQQEVRAYFPQFAEHLFIILDAHQYPVCITADGMEIHMTLIAVFIFNGFIAHLIFICLYQLMHHLEQLTILTCQQVSFLSHYKTLGALIELSFFHYLLEPIEGNVRTHDSHNLTFVIVHWHTIGCHHRLGPIFVRIRLAPVAAILCYWLGVEIYLRIIMFCRAQLHGLNRSVSPSHGIRFKPVSFLWEVIWHEGYHTSQDGRVVLHQPTGDRIHPVRILQIVGHHPCHVIHRHLHFGQFVTDTKIDGVHLTLYQFLHRPVDNILRRVVQSPRCQFQHEGCTDDEGQRQMIPDHIA